MQQKESKCRIGFNTLAPLTPGMPFSACTPFFELCHGRIVLLYGGLALDLQWAGCQSSVFTLNKVLYYYFCIFTIVLFSKG